MDADTHLDLELLYVLGRPRTRTCTPVAQREGRDACCLTSPPHTPFCYRHRLCCTAPRTPTHRNHTTHSPRSNIENTHTPLPAGSYGSLARFKDLRRIIGVGESTLVGAGGEYSDFQEIGDMLNKLVYVQTHMPRKIVLCWGNGERERETVLWNLARVKEVRLILPTNSSRVVAPAARVHGDGTRTPHGPSHVVTFPYTRPPPQHPPDSSHTGHCPFVQLYTHTHDHHHTRSSIRDKCANDGSAIKASEIHSYLTRVMYQRRNKGNPLYNSIIVGGFKGGEGYVYAEAATEKSRRVPNGFPSAWR